MRGPQLHGLIHLLLGLILWNNPKIIPDGTEELSACEDVGEFESIAGTPQTSPGKGDGLQVFPGVLFPRHFTVSSYPEILECVTASSVSNAFVPFSKVQA